MPAGPTRSAPKRGRRCDPDGALEAWSHIWVGELRGVASDRPRRDERVELANRARRHGSRVRRSSSSAAGCRAPDRRFRCYETVRTFQREPAIASATDARHAADPSSPPSGRWLRDRGSSSKPRLRLKGTRTALPLQIDRIDSRSFGSCSLPIWQSPFKFGRPDHLPDGGVARRAQAPCADPRGRSD
jgi:hypothetical protein